MSKTEQALRTVRKAAPGDTVADGAFKTYTVLADDWDYHKVDGRHVVCHETGRILHVSQLTYPVYPVAKVTTC